MHEKLKSAAEAAIKTTELIAAANAAEGPVASLVLLPLIRQSFEIAGQLEALLAALETPENPKP